MSRHYGYCHICHKEPCINCDCGEVLELQKRVAALEQVAADGTAPTPPLWVPNWQPIETAKKEQKTILLGCIGVNGYAEAGSWEPSLNQFAVLNDDGDDYIQPPTHWAPWPAKPGGEVAPPLEFHPGGRCLLCAENKRCSCPCLWCQQQRYKGMDKNAAPRPSGRCLRCGGELTPELRLCNRCIDAINKSSPIHVDPKLMDELWPGPVLPGGAAAAPQAQTVVGVCPYHHDKWKMHSQVYCACLCTWCQQQSYKRLGENAAPLPDCPRGHD
jgi:hypothetical protein